MRRYDHGGDIYGDTPVQLDFSVNTNPLGLPERVIDAVRQGATEDGCYPDPHCRALRRELARQHGVSPERILCGAGGAELILRICACLRPRRVVLPAPTFSEYARCSALFGAEITEIPFCCENGFAPDESFLSALTPETELVFLCQPNNPTGRLWDEALLKRIADICEETGTYLLVDESFIEFTQADSALTLQWDHPNLIVLRAFTKYYAMAGLRLGYLLCADGALADRIDGYGAEWSVSAPAQRAGLAALTESDWRERTLALVSRERQWLTAQLTALGIRVFPGEANFLLCRAEKDVSAALAERGILVRRCGTFTGLDDTYFRIGVRRREENHVLIETLREVLHG